MVPEWDANYIKYKSLKKLIKSAVEAKKNGEEPDLAGKIHSDQGTWAARANMNRDHRLLLLP